MNDTEKNDTDDIVYTVEGNRFNATVDRILLCTSIVIAWDLREEWSKKINSIDAMELIYQSVLYCKYAKPQVNALINEAIYEQKDIKQIIPDLVEICKPCIIEQLKGN